MRKSLGLDRLPVKVNKQQTTSTLELWVLYQQLKLTSAADAARSLGQQLAEEKRHGKANQLCNPDLSLLYDHSESDRGQVQTRNGMSALQQSNLSENVASASGNLNQISAGFQPQHNGQHTRQVHLRSDALSCIALIPCWLVVLSSQHKRDKSWSIIVYKSVLTLCIFASAAHAIPIGKTAAHAKPGDTALL